jgi:hypothetical protein
LVAVVGNGAFELSKQLEMNTITVLDVHFGLLQFGFAKFSPCRRSDN